MALPSTLVFEARSSGSSSNGGAFDPTIGTVDYTYPNSIPTSATDLVIQSDNTKISSLTIGFISAHVGNILNISAGSGFTVGRYLILSVSGGIATLDRACGTAGSTAGSGIFGGAITVDSWLSLTVTLGNVTAGWTCWAKNGGTQAITSAYATHFVPGTAASRITLAGYGTTRGDQVSCVLTPGAISWGIILGPYWTVQDIEINATSVPYGFYVYQNSVLLRCTVRNGNVGFFHVHPTACGSIRNCYAYNCTTGFLIQVYGRYIAGCVADTCGTGFLCDCSNNSVHIPLSHCLARNCSGDGFSLGNAVLLESCTADFNGGNGFNLAASCSDVSVLVNCLASNNGQYGVKFGDSNTLTNSLMLVGGVAFYNNTSGATNQTPAVPAGCISLTASPYVTPGSDYRPNSTSGGGALLRGAGYPLTYPNYPSIANNIDIGAYQHSDSAGVTTTPPTITATFS